MCAYLYSVWFAFAFMSPAAFIVFWIWIAQQEQVQISNKSEKSYLPAMGVE